MAYEVKAYKKVCQFWADLYSYSKDMTMVHTACRYIVSRRRGPIIHKTNARILVSEQFN